MKKVLKITVLILMLCLLVMPTYATQPVSNWEFYGAVELYNYELSEYRINYPVFKRFVWHDELGKFFTEYISARGLRVQSWNVPNDMNDLSNYSTFYREIPFEYDELYTVTGERVYADPTGYCNEGEYGYTFETIDGIEVIQKTERVVDEETGIDFPVYSYYRIDTLMQIDFESGYGEKNSIYEIIPGTSVSIPECSFTHDGYTFSHWTDGTNNYYLGDAFIMPDHDVTMTAVWIKDEKHQSVSEKQPTSSVYVSNGNEFEGKTICINPGHQKKGNSELELMSPISDTLKAKVTSGAKGEEEYNLKIAKVLKEILEDMGAKVVMTRETSDVDVSNKERAIIGNKADLVLNIHCNSSDNANAKGTWLLTPSQKNLGNKDIYENSKRLAEKIKVSMSDYRNVKIFERDDLTGLNWSDVPSIFIECGFLTNEEDKEFLDEISIEKDEYRSYEDVFYYRICKGIYDYFYGVEKITVNHTSNDVSKIDVEEIETTKKVENLEMSNEIPKDNKIISYILLISFGAVIIGGIVFVIYRIINRKKE